MKLSKNLTLREAIKSSTAVRLNISNRPTLEHTENLKAVAKKIFQPIRDHFGVPIGITSGYRSEALNQAIGGSSKSQHCFDEKTEILTNKGFKKFNEVKEEEVVLTYNTKENILEHKKGNTVILNYEGIMIKGESKHLDYLVTPDHRMYTSHGNKNKFNFELAKDTLNKRRIFKVASIKENQNEIPCTVTEAKLCLAVIADGCIYLKKGCKKPTIKFNLSKTRKIEYLKELLETLDVNYNIRYCKSREKQNQFGVYEININGSNSEFFINLITKNKLIPQSFLNYSSENLKQLINCYTFFNEYVDKRENCTSSTITSACEHNVDALQQMCLMSDQRCIKSRSNHNTSLGNFKGWSLSITPRNISRLNETNTSLQDYKGKVWCINNENTTLIVRRNGKVFISGNCKGQAIDIDADIFGKITNHEIFFYVKDNLEYDQLIAEFYDDGNPAWVHVSYKTVGNNRKSTLIATKVKGKTEYLAYSDLIYSQIYS